MTIRFAIAAIVTALSLIASQANAAVVTKNISFSATNFIAEYDTPVPVSTVTGNFTITFDPTLSYSDQTAGVVLNSLNIPIDSAIAFDYDPTGGSYPGQLLVGGLQYGAGVLAFPTNDFVLMIKNIASSPSLTLFAYGQTSPVWSESLSTTGSVTVSDVAAAVPEPSTWLSLILGFGMIGAGLRSRQRQTVRCNLA